MKTWQKLKANPTLWEQYLIREKVFQSIREYFKKRQFHEVQTPTLVSIPSCEPNLEAMETKIKTARGNSQRAFLIMSPEFAIKKLLAAGIGNCFEIAKVFRNGEEVTRLHLPEFTMLEWYQVGVNYQTMMTAVEQLFIKLSQKIRGEVDLTKWPYQGERYNISLPWPRISIAQAFSKYAKIKTDTLVDQKALLETAKRKNYQITPKTTWEQAFYQIFFNEVEPQLARQKRPYFLYDYPVEQASLARKKKSDSRFAERFEVFFGDIELGNCFSELTDPKEQAERFANDLNKRQKDGKSNVPIDLELIEALESGLPEVAGIAMGVDRLVMLMANVPTIAETLTIPGKELFDLE